MANPLNSVMQFHPKLRACLVNDRDHIGLETSPAKDRRGIHVQIIKKALNVFANERGLDPLDEDNDLFDQDTADMVMTFKELNTSKPILNFTNQIDAIVGKKTIAALDDRLPFQGLGE